MTLTEERVNEMIRHALEFSVITSAGGDSPKTNKVVGIDLAAPQETADGGLGSAGGVAGFKGSDVSLGLAATRGDIGGLIGRAGASLGPAAALAIAPQLIPLVIKELERPGGFLDKRVRIEAQEEAFAELDRQTRQNTRIGDRQVIIHTSDLIRTNADRVLDIGLFDRAQGVSIGGQ
jgi:hypothetical protein